MFIRASSLNSRIECSRLLWLVISLSRPVMARTGVLLPSSNYTLEEEPFTTSRKDCFPSCTARNRSRERMTTSSIACFIRSAFGECWLDLAQLLFDDNHYAMFCVGDLGGSDAGVVAASQHHLSGGADIASGFTTCPTTESRMIDETVRYATRKPEKPEQQVHLRDLLAAN